MEVPRKLITSSIIQITPIKNVVVQEVASPEENDAVPIIVVESSPSTMEKPPNNHETSKGYMKYK